MITYSSGGLTVDQITGSMTNGIGQLENNIQQMMNQISANPSPSPQQMLQLQVYMSLWSNLFTVESSIVKVFGDTLKTIANNMGQ